MLRVFSGRLLVLSLLFVASSNDILNAQQGDGMAPLDSPANAISNRVLRFAGTIPNQPDGAVLMNFAIYGDQEGTAPLWSESQTVQVKDGRYAALLGSSSSAGIPPEVFVGDAPHWLGIQISNGPEQRQLFISVAYAMKAVEAERLGGRLASDYVTTEQLRAIVRGAAATSSPNVAASASTASPAPAAAAPGTPPQPATDFTDNNTSEVLLVTQQGTGYAVHAISSGAPAIFAENSSTTGIAIEGLASASTGQTVGITGKVASPSGIAGVFDNTGGGQILSLRSNGNEVASVDQTGSFFANGIFGNTFSGNGQGLFNIPNSATTATPTGTPNTIVARDANGTFFANGVFANNLSGNGQGLFNIPNAATTASPTSAPNTIVARDANGDFFANSVIANNLSGNGQGLFNIPNSATTATPTSTPNSIVARDANGTFFANGVFANTFSGNGQGLFNIPNSATTATPTSTPNSIVARDANGIFFASGVFANSFSGNGQGLFNIPNTATTATPTNTVNTIVARDANGDFFARNLNIGGISAAGGTADFSNAVATMPVRSVLAANTPAQCNASKELLIKTDVQPGQQLFICNSNGNGYVLLGDGTSTGVASIGAGDSSIVLGGTASSPTVAIASGGVTGDKLAPNAVVSSIADGSLSPAKIAGQAAVLGSNTFSGSQTIQQNLTVQGSLQSNFGIVTSNLLTGTASVSPTTTSGAALSVVGGNPSISVSSGTTGVFSSSSLGAGVHGDGPVGVEAVTSNGVGLQVKATGNSGVAATFTAVDPGLLSNTQVKLISGLGTSSGAGTNEKFNVDTAGDIFAAGALTTQVTNSPTQGTSWRLLASLDANGNAVRATNPQSGIMGVVVGGAGFTGKAQIAYEGIAYCGFHGATTAGDFVGSYGDGSCLDLGAQRPASGAIIGRVLATMASDLSAPVLLYGPDQMGLPSTAIASINTGSGLTGGPITSTGTIAIANAGVTNGMLQNSSVTINPGAGLSGGGPLALGSAVTLNNTGALSFNGRSGAITSASGDYSFSQLSGSAAPSQLPTALAYTNQTSDFSLGLSAESFNGTAIQATVSNPPSAPNNGIAGVFTNVGGGEILSGRTGNQSTEVFNVWTNGSIFSSGSISASLPSYQPYAFLLARLDAGGFADIADTSGAGVIGIFQGQPGGAGKAYVSYSGLSHCRFDAPLYEQQHGDYVGASQFAAGYCSDLGANYPTVQSNGQSRQVIGRVLRIAADDPDGIPTIILYASEQRSDAASLASSSIDILPGSGLSGGGPVSLGGTVVLSNNGVLSFNGRSGNIVPGPNDYSFSMLSGIAGTGQLPSSVVYNNQANTFAGNQTVTGTMSATAFNGDGSQLANVNAAKLGGFAPSDLATSASLNSESTARQNGDATLQTSLNSEVSARQAGENSLQASISSVDSASAKLAASNSFISGTQDFSGAGATLPVRALPVAQTPASCVSNKELLIKTDAPAGRQLFICNSDGATWSVVGDGASGGVTAFNGRAGSVSPASGDYSFNQISGSLAATQMPAFSGDVVTSSGSTTTTLSASGITAGTYTKVIVDAKGRATAGLQASFADISGAATAAQLPSTVAYTAQGNVFTGNQTVNGSLAAVSLSGDGTAVTNVNAAGLNGLTSASFAQLATANAFASKQSFPASKSSSASVNIASGLAPATPTAGDLWNSGGVLQYRDNASANRSVVTTPQTAGLQLIKLTASITPASIAQSVCSEQSFSVSGLALGDVLIGVAQPSSNSPGLNIAIGGWRVSAANTVAIQFCNVSRSTSTPTSGTYMFAVMR